MRSSSSAIRVGSSALLVCVNVRGSVLADARYLVMVLKAFAEVASLTDVDGPEPVWLGFFCEDIVARHLLHWGAEGLDPIAIHLARLSFPIDDSFGCHERLL